MDAPSNTDRLTDDDLDRFFRGVAKDSPIGRLVAEVRAWRATQPDAPTLPPLGSKWQPKDDRDGPAKTVVGFDGTTHAYIQGAIRTRVRLPLEKRFRRVG